MAIKYGFFDSVGGDRKYNAEDIGRYLQGIVCSGVYADTSSSLQVLASSGMQVEVRPGRAMLDYHYMENDSPLTLTLSAGGTLARIDAIVARLDASNRVCEIAVKQGTPASNPQRPAMTRSDAKKEYMLAAVYVGKLATTITQENITDTRPDTSVCGWVAGVIDQVDTSTLFAQYNAAYAQELANMREYARLQQQAFAEFFASLTGDLRVETYVQEYKNLVVLAEDTDTVAIGIDDYDPAVDVLFVNHRGLLYMEKDYTVSGSGPDAIVTLTEARKAGDPIEFRVLKSVIGSATAANVLALDADGGSVLTDGGATLALE